MFKVHSIIIDLMDINPLKIKDEKFQALNLLQTDRQHVVEKAKQMRSFAFQFYFLCLTFQQIKNQHRTIDRQKDIKNLRRQLRKWERRVTIL